jgi:hypothetical protein
VLCGPLIVLYVVICGPLIVLYHFVDPSLFYDHFVDHCLFYEHFVDHCLFYDHFVDHSLFYDHFVDHCLFACICLVCHSIDCPCSNNNRMQKQKKMVCNIRILIILKCSLFHFHSFVDEIKKCIKPLEKCRKPRQVQRLREFIDEIKSDVCTLTQGIVSRIQETMNVDTLDVNSFSYRY